MVDISLKEITKRVAIAQSTISLSNELFEAIENGLIKKGDPLQVAQIAGIMAAKKQQILFRCATQSCFKEVTSHLIIKKQIMDMT